MPGHKGTAECLAPLAAALKLDITELPDTGSLFDSAGPTARAEELATAVFQSTASFMSTGGCTLCIQAMFRLAVPCGGKLLCGRTIHRAAVNAMAMLDIEPVWLLPDDSAGPGFSGRITAESVKCALIENSDVKAIYLTSPDYFGVLSDIRSIAEIAARADIPLLVDNAHGTHLGFLKGFKSPLAAGAAMSADSAHKTLPVLTGGAWLNIGDPRFVEGARGAMALFGSTSPSYPVMVSLDLCRAWLEEKGAAELERVRTQTAEIKDILCQRGFAVPAGMCDPLRVAFHGGDGWSARAAGAMLREHGVEPEYAGPGGLILIPSPFNTPEDFARLSTAMEAMARHSPPDAVGTAPVAMSLPPAVMRPREAVTAVSETVAVNSAVGRIAAAAACPCPPAIPAIMPGERITPAVCAIVSQYGIHNISVVK